MTTTHQQVVLALKEAAQKALQTTKDLPPAHPQVKAATALAERLEAAATLHSRHA